MSRESALVSADWVEKNLDDDDIVFVEVDEDVSAYDAGHIQGAVTLDWKTELQDQVRRDFVNKEQFEALLTEKGIANDDTVVLYGGNNNWFAAYAYWYFKLYGHEDLRLLDGGRKKWELDGRPLTDKSSARDHHLHRPGAGPLDPRLPRRGRRRDRRQEPGRRPHARRVQRQAAGAAHLPQEQSQRPGHIPGALNVPWSKAANEDGTFRSDDELRKLYEEGLDDGKETIAYCRIGERSTHTWFVLQELLGHENVKNYDGSWTEYGSLVGVPIELGSGKVTPDMCGAPTQGQGLEGVDVTKETVIQGVVTADGAPVPSAYVRLLDGTGEFTAEVQASATGQFRFFAAPGDWTLRTLVPRRDAVDKKVTAKVGEVTEVEITL